MMKIGCYAGITRPSVLLAHSDIPILIYPKHPLNPVAPLNLPSYHSKRTTKFRCSIAERTFSSSSVNSSVSKTKTARLGRKKGGSSVISSSRYRRISCNIKNLKVRSTAKEVDSQAEEEELKLEQEPNETTKTSIPTSSALDANLKKAVQKTAATFAPRASTASKNPAVPGSTLYSVFEIQGYISMLLGGALSFNLIFPSNEPDLWRLMGMWSIWMFTIPSLRARDCSKKEKEALNYLFILVPLINVLIPFFYKSFAVVWSADTFAFFGMYAWKMGWLQKTE